MPDDLAIMNDVVGYLAEPARGIMLAKANKPGGGGFGVLEYRYPDMQSAAGYGIILIFNSKSQATWR